MSLVVHKVNNQGCVSPAGSGRVVGSSGRLPLSPGGQACREKQQWEGGPGLPGDTLSRRPTKLLSLSWNISITKSGSKRATARAQGKPDGFRKPTATLIEEIGSPSSSLAIALWCARISTPAVSFHRRPRLDLRTLTDNLRASPQPPFLLPS